MREKLKRKTAETFPKHEKNVIIIFLWHMVLMATFLINTDTEFKKKFNA